MSEPIHQGPSNNNSTKTSINSQIIDSIKEVNELLSEGEKNLNTASNQVLTQAAGMAMLNMVNQQQQMYILQNTVTTVAAKAMLESNPEEAVKLMNTVIENNNITSGLKDLKDLLSGLQNG